MQKVTYESIEAEYSLPGIIRHILGERRPIHKNETGCLAFHRIISNHVHLDAGNTAKAILLPEPVC